MRTYEAAARAHTRELQNMAGADRHNEVVSIRPEYIVTFPVIGARAPWIVPTKQTNHSAVQDLTRHRNTTAKALIRDCSIFENN